MDLVEEIHVDPTAGNTKTVDLAITPPLSLQAIMETFMTTQATYGQLINELLIEVAALRVDFAKYKSAFPLPPPFDP